MSSRFTDYEIMIAFLAIYARADRALHVQNVLGAQYRSAELEKELGGIQFTLEERAQGMRCARELQELGLIVPTYSDLTNPEEWRVITEAGRHALNRGTLDDLDRALWELSADFVDMRRGAWRAANSSAPDTLRQAAHSGRELVTQVLHAVSPDEEVRGRSWFHLDPSKPNVVTRKNRYRNAIETRGRGWSESDLAIALKGADLLEAQYAKLSSEAHSRSPVDRQAVLDALTTVDMVLRILLL
ncbi:hypothetical protein ACCT04_02245 [Rhizobium ruizarguesonis]